MIIPISGKLISVDVMSYHYTSQLSQWQRSVRDSIAYEDFVLVFHLTPFENSAA